MIIPTSRLKVSRAQAGLVTVESTIVLTVFFLLILAIVDGGRLIYSYGMVSHVAHEGVRYAAVRGTEAGQDNRRIGDAAATSAQIESYVKSKAVSVSPLRVFTTWPQDGRGLAIKNAGQILEVRVEYDFEPVTPFLLPISPLTLTSTSRMVIYF